MPPSVTCVTTGSQASGPLRVSAQLYAPIPMLCTGSKRDAQSGSRHSHVEASSFGYCWRPTRQMTTGAACMYVVNTMQCKLNDTTTALRRALLIIETGPRPRHRHPHRFIVFSSGVLATIMHEKAPSVAAWCHRWWLPRWAREPPPRHYPSSCSPTTCARSQSTHAPIRSLLWCRILVINATSGIPVDLRIHHATPF